MLVGLCAALSACDGPGALVASQFNANAEGWTVNGDGEGPELRAVGGNPGGHICGKDKNQGDLWYFVAPAPFTGDVSKAYGLRMTWDLKETRSTFLIKGRDVIIQGIGAAIVFNIKQTPGTDWTSYWARLDASANSGWKLDEPGFPDATELDIKNVFKSVKSLRIRGEFADAEDSACIDNVYFGIE